MKVLFDARLHHGVECGMSRYIINLLTHLADINQISLTVIEWTLTQTQTCTQVSTREYSPLFARDANGAGSSADGDKWIRPSRRDR